MTSPRAARTELSYRPSVRTQLSFGPDRERDGGPALVVVAHGSRDPRSAATIGALADVVRRQCSPHPAGCRPLGSPHPAGSAGCRPPGPDLDVRVCFLDLSAPRLPDVLAAVAADGHRHAVVVPLLLGSAFHARVDVPAAVERAARAHPSLRITTSDVLGDTAEPAALSRLCEALADPDPAPDLRDPALGVVLASVGSTRPEANADVAARVQRWRERFGWAAASAAHVTAAEPSVAQAIRDVRAAGAARVAVVPWVLAPGRLPDRIDADAVDGGAILARPIGAHPELASAVLRRWAEAGSAPADTRRAG